MSVWTIEYLGVEKAAADWGLNAHPVIRTRDRSPTRMSFAMAGADMQTAVPFPFRAKVIIRQNRTAGSSGFTGTGFVFTGYQNTANGRVDGNSQAVMIDFEDVIWLLQNTTFQQGWKQVVSDGHGGTTTTTIPVSRVILFMDVNASFNTIKTVQWQIGEIIDWAVACGIEIQAGTIELSTWQINYYHVRAISCWDALLKCLEPVPDAKMWVDGSTTPPTLHVRTRSSLAALSAPTTTAPGPIILAWRGKDAQGRSHFNTELRPRYDLIPPQVVLQYQQNNTVNGANAPAFATDAYPALSDGKTPFAMVVPIDLTGNAFTQLTGRLDCETVVATASTHAAKRAWWAGKRGGEQDKLSDARLRFQDAYGVATLIGDATITDDNGAAIDLTAYPRRIVGGTYHAWMNGIVAIRAHLRVKVQTAEYDVVGSGSETDTSGNVTHRSPSHELHCHITLTNAPAGVTNFSGWDASGDAETAVTGLAQNIYTARNTLDYDGAHEIIDPGINGARIPLAQIIGHWNVLNLSGGAAAWAAANMTIAGTEIDLQTNHQRIEIGPAQHLSPQDWNEMLQFFRVRRQFIPSSTRTSGYSDGGSTFDMARNTPDGNTVPGLNVSSALIAIHYTIENDPASPVLGKFNLLAKDIADTLGGFSYTLVDAAIPAWDVRARESQFCDALGNIVYAMMPRGGYYTKP